MPGAFSGALSANEDILALMYHDPKLILGRRSRGTLKILEDNKGLYVEISPPDTSVGRDALENIRRGDIAGMSFRFAKAKDAWARNGAELVRTIHTIGKLHEVTLTPIPAYEATSASVRAADVDEAAAYIKARIAELEATPARDALGKRMGY
jgi:HK97 family phage prohead protease